jgi:hypothetical protein
MKTLQASYPEAQSPPQTASTMTARAACDQCWASSGTLEFIVHDDRLAANPINNLDPNGTMLLSRSPWVKVWQVTGPERLAYNGYKYSDGVKEYPTAHWRFSIHAEFEGFGCANLEYRQYVKGYLAIDDHIQRFNAFRELNRTNYLEDSSYGRHFGHRTDAGLIDDHYSTSNGTWDQKKGMIFDMYDEPGTTIDYTWFWGSTYKVEIHMDFLFMVVDTSSSKPKIVLADSLAINDVVWVTATKVKYPHNWRQLEGGWA